MKAILSILTFLTFNALFLSCKKEKTKPSENIGTAQNISTDSINGDMTIAKSYLINNDSLVFAGNSASAIFFQGKACKSYTMSPQTVDVGNLSLNGVQFSKLTGSSYYTYIDTTGTSFTMPYHWQIQGANGHLGFNTTDYLDFPTCSPVSPLSDTLMIDQQDTIRIGNYSGTSATILILSGSSNGYIIKQLEYPANSIILFPHEYSDLNLTEGSASIVVYINKSNYKAINGKIYRFTTQISYSKYIYLKTQ